MSRRTRAGRTVASASIAGANGLTVAPRGGWVVVSVGDVVMSRDPGSLALIRRVVLEEGVAGSSVVGDGGIVAVPSERGFVDLVNMSSGEARGRVLVRERMKAPLLWVEDLLVAGSVGGTLSAWRMVLGRARAKNEAPITAAAYGGDGLWLGDQQGRVGVEKASHQVLDAPVTQLVAEGGTIVAGSANTLAIWRDGKVRFRYQAEISKIFSTDVSLDGSVVAFSDGSLHLWKSGTGSVKAPWISSSEALNIRQLALDPLGRWVAAGDWQDRVYVWSLADGERKADLRTPFPFQGMMTFSRDGKGLAVAGSDGAVQIWNVEGWRRGATIPGPGVEARRLGWMGIADPIMIHYGDGRVVFWNDEARAEIELPRLPSLRGLVQRPDGQALALLFEDGGVRTWSLSAHQQSGALLLKRALKSSGRMLSGVELGPPNHWAKPQFRRLTADTKSVQPGTVPR